VLCEKKHGSLHAIWHWERFDRYVTTIWHRWVETVGYSRLLSGNSRSCIKAISHEVDEVDCIQSFCHSLFLLVVDIPNGSDFPKPVGNTVIQYFFSMRHSRIVSSYCQCEYIISNLYLQIRNRIDFAKHPIREPLSTLFRVVWKKTWKWWFSWLQCKCEWWSTSRIQKSKWIIHSYFSK
jgi:hypothetical protein